MGPLRRALAVAVLPLVPLVPLVAGCGEHSAAGGTSAASCAGPYLSDQPPGGAYRGPVPRVRPGGVITVYGHWYTDGCNDTGGHEPLRPLPPVHLTVLLPGGAVEAVGEFRPGGRDVGFVAAVRVPAGTPAGTATVRDDRPLAATYRFVVGRARAHKPKFG